MYDKSSSFRQAKIFRNIFSHFGCLLFEWTLLIWVQQILYPLTYNGEYFTRFTRLLLRTPGPVPLWDLQVF